MNRKSRRSAAKQIKSSPASGIGAHAIEIAINQAVTDSQADRHGQAEKVLRQILSAKPDHPEALHQLGMTLARTERSAEGLDYLRRSVQLRPNEALYWNNLAACCVACDALQEGIEAGRRAVEIEPGYGMAWDNLGAALLACRQYAEAAVAFERSIKLMAPDLSTLKRAANCAAHLNDRTGAERHLRAACKLAPEDPEALANLGSVLLAGGDHVAAIDMLGRATAINPNNLTAALNYGLALLKADDRPAALRWLRRATSVDHRSVDAWRQLAEVLLLDRQYDEAIVAADRAVALAPADRSLADLRRQAWARGGIVPAVAPEQPVREPSVLDFYIPEAPAEIPSPLQPAAAAQARPGVLEFQIPAAAQTGAEAAKDKGSKTGTTGLIDLTILEIK
jgi:tetratricopeptide (TPR) repeat protein